MNECNLQNLMNNMIEMEKKGADFYKESAVKFPEIAKFFNLIAKEEEGHVKLFNKILEKASCREIVKEKDWNEIPKYMIAILEGREIDGIKSVFLLHKDVTLKDVFKYAFEREEDAILYYLGLKKIFTCNECLELVESIISEEMKHIAWLNDKKREFVL